MLYPWVILSLADLLAVNLSPAILVDRSWQSLKSCLPFLERPRRCCPCPWFWPDFHQDLCESPSTDILASFHGWSGMWDLGFLFKTWSLPCMHTAKYEKSLLCLDFPLVYMDFYCCILTLLQLCFVAQNPVIPGIKERKPFLWNPDWALSPSSSLLWNSYLSFSQKMVVTFLETLWLIM